jgi:hypothetical protein
VVAAGRWRRETQLERVQFKIQSSALCGPVLVIGYFVQRLASQVLVCRLGSLEWETGGIMITACERAFCSFSEFIFHILCNFLYVLIPSTFHN